MTSDEEQRITRAVESVLNVRDRVLEGRINDLQRDLETKLKRIFLRLGGRDVGDDGKPVIGLGEEVRLLQMQMRGAMLVGVLIVGSLVALGVNVVFGKP